MRRLTRLAVFLAALILIPLVLAGAALLFAQTSPGRTMVANLVSSLASGPDRTLTIGSLEGKVPFDMTLRNVALADADGTWLEIDRARLAWNPVALGSGRLVIEAIEVGEVDVARAPLPGEAPAEPGGMPVLPFELILDRLSVERLVLAEPLLGEAATLGIEGSARLGEPSEGLSAQLSVERLDGTAGRIDADMTYAPETELLNIRLGVDEAPGGIVSRMIGTPGLPALRLNVDGEGTLDDFTAELTLAAEDRARAQGTAAMRRVAEGRRLEAALTGELAGLVPADLSGLVEGTTTLNAEAVFRDAGPIDVETFQVLTAAGLVSVSGVVDRQGAGLGLDFEVVAGESRRFSGVMPVPASWTGIEASGRIEGPVDRPGVRMRLTGEGVSVDGNRIGELDTTLEATPRGPLGDPATTVDVVLDGNAGGISPADARLAQAVGGQAAWRIAGSGSRAGGFDADEARVELPAGTVTWTGLVTAERIDGRVATEGFDLAVVSGLAGRDLAGQARLHADVAAAFDGRSLSIDADGAVTNPRTGIAALDGAVGGEVTIAGGVRRAEDGSFAFDSVRIDGETVALAADGRADTGSADVTATVALSDLSRLDGRLTGRANVEARLTGSLEDLALDGRATLSDATAMDRPLDGLEVEVQAVDLTGAPRGSFGLGGSVDGKPVTGTGRFAQAGGGYALNGLDVGVGTVRIAGDVTLDEAMRGVGRLTLRAGDLADVSALLLTDLAGALDADVELNVSGGVQVARVRADGRSLRFDETRIGNVTATANLTDPAGSLSLDADVVAQAINAGGTRLDRVEITADGGLDASEFRIDASGFDAGLQAAGRLSRPDGAITVDLASLSITGRGRTARLTSPSTIRVVDGGAEIANLSLTTGQGSLTVSGRAAQTLDLTATLDALPVSLVEIAAPGTGISGTVSGNARLTGPAGDPRGNYRLNVSGLSVPAMRQAGLAALGVSASGEVANGRVGVQANVSGPTGMSLDVSGSVPMAAGGSLDITTRGRIQLAMFSDLLAATGDRIAGPLDVDLRISGPAAQPAVSGTARMSGGSFTSPLNGITLTDIALQATGRERALEISSLSARTSNGGQVSGSGSVTVDPAAGFPIDLRLRAQNAQLISSDVVTATADADLTLRGPAARRPQLGGTVTVRRMEITLPETLGRSGAVIQVQHRNAPAALQAQIAREARREEAARTGGGAAPFAMELDLRVVAANQVFVRGQGIDAELGGEVTVRGTSANPVVLGGFDLRRGQVVLLSQRINFTHGRITFPGTLDPELDLVAETTARSITARIGVTGRASAPRVGFSSSPELPEDEVLSRLLFDKATAELTAGEAIQLAQAVAQLTGVAGGGDGLVENLRRKLGVDVLDVTAGADGPALGIGRYIDDNIYLGVRQGATAQSSRVTVDIDITPNIKARGEVGADGRSSVGVSVEWDY